MEYASNGKGNLGVTLGAIGTGLGVLGMNGLSGIIGGGGQNYVTKETYDVQLQLIDAQKSNAILAADLASEKKMVDVFNAANDKINNVRDELQAAIREVDKKVDANAAAQAVINCGMQSATAVLQSQVGQLIAMTKTVIPSDNICPKPMPEYNSWVAPTA